MNVEGGQILRELQEVDEATLHFSAWGLGGRLRPEDSAAYLAGLLDHAALVEAVPEDIRLEFDRVRSVFMHGLLNYDLFTAAYSLAHVALEGALRHRFISFYEGRIPIKRRGVDDFLAVSSFADYREAVQAAPRGDRICLRETSDEPAPMGYPALFGWARRRGLLIGQRNVVVLDSIKDSRNYIAHPERHTVNMPPSVFRFLRDVAEIINRLWGHDTPGGRLFPKPIPRWARAAALSPDRTRAVTFGSLAGALEKTDRLDWMFALYVAAAQEDLIVYDNESPGHQRFAFVPGFQTGEFPMQPMWGPGCMADLGAAIGEFSDAAPVDEVAFLDRTFYVRRRSDGVIELPRDGSDVRTGVLVDASTSWQVVIADFPIDALFAARELFDNPSATLVNATHVVSLAGDAAALEHAEMLA
ncbi:MAG TPA: hypothetical protein VNS09_13900 [Solirubrobacter sp.]|nr:hypothetical protein [Solirubrobacter sp.]